MGELPEWYTLLVASKSLGVAPWELAAQPEVWRQWALSANLAEQQARTEVERHEAKRGGNRNRVARRRPK